MQPLREIKTRLPTLTEWFYWRDKTIENEGREPTKEERAQLWAMFCDLFVNVRIFENDIYKVSLSWEFPYRISIRRHDNAPCHNWRDFQEIKNQLLDPDHNMVEVYPDESRLLDTDNVYHLWSAQIEHGWNIGRHVWPDQTARGSRAGSGARMRSRNGGL